MPRINGQTLVFLLVGAVLLLVGLNSIRGEKSDSAQFGSVPAGRSGEGEGTGRASEANGSGLRVSGGSRKLVVDVSGAVRRPGVYRFDHGARVIDAITRAGGTTRQATVGAINRAATLSDGQQVVVPAAAGSAAEVEAESGAAGGAATLAPPDAPVSIGMATKEQLEEIDGIGPVTAQKILEFRDARGGIGSIDELDQISGIGPVTMESLRAALTP